MNNLESNILYYSETSDGLATQKIWSQGCEQIIKSLWDCFITYKIERVKQSLLIYSSAPEGLRDKSYAWGGKQRYQ